MRSKAGCGCLLYHPRRTVIETQHYNAFQTTQLWVSPPGGSYQSQSHCDQGREIEAQATQGKSGRGLKETNQGYLALL